MVNLVSSPEIKGLPFSGLDSSEIFCSPTSAFDFDSEMKKRKNEVYPNLR